MIRNNGPVAVIDWKRFYEMRDDDLDRWIGTRKLLSNQEAVNTGLLLCKYFVFVAFFQSALFLISLFVIVWGQTISMIIVFSFVRIGRRAGCVKPSARSPPLSTKQHLVVRLEDIVRTSMAMSSRIGD